MKPDVLDQLRLDGKVAVMTGAASGIGEAAAELFAAAGAKVACGDLDAEKAAETAERIRTDGGEALSLATDVTKREDVDALVDRAYADWGRVDVMCNVPGAMFPGLLEDVKDDVVDAGIDLHIKATLYGCQAAVRVMKGQGSGSIINFSSGAIDLPYEGIGVYAFTKAAVAMLSKTLAKEVGPHGIRVNALAPGSTITNFTTWRLRNDDGTMNQAAYDEFIEFAKGMSPLGITGEAMDQAYLMLYLASDAARYVTGGIHRANGGQTWAW